MKPKRFNRCQAMQHHKSSGNRELGQKQSIRDITDFQSNGDTQAAMEWKF